MLPDPFPVMPWTAPCRGEIRLPGSKSLTNRALVLAALGHGRSHLKDALFSRDSRILCDSLEALGFEIRSDEGQRTITIWGSAGRIPRQEAELHVGNAGTAARFLTALVALHPSGTYHFDGDEEMRARPMAGLINTLESQGAKFTYHGQPGHFPFTIHTSGLQGGAWRVDASASSQMLSALMMVAPCTGSPVQIVASGARPAFVQMTASLMNRFGVDIQGSPASGYSIPGFQAYACPEEEYSIEPDVTAASYFMALPYVVGGSLRIHGLHDDMLQGDLAFAGVLREFGMNINPDSSGWTVSFPDIPVRHPASFSFEKFSDTFLTFAAIAPLFPGPVIIEGIGHTRFQECNRISAMATGLQKIGVRVVEEQTALSIWPFDGEGGQPPPAITIDSFKDHRVAMSFTILGCRDLPGTGKPWLHVADPACAGKTFPGFFGELEKLYQISHDS